MSYEDKDDSVAKRFTYVISFSSGRKKIGITKSPLSRLANYVRESTRQGVSITGFFISKPLSKETAQRYERDAKKTYANYAVTGHTETFYGVTEMELRIAMFAIGNTFDQEFASACGKAGVSTMAQRVMLLLEMEAAGLLRCYDHAGRKIARAATA